MKIVDIEFSNHIQIIISKQLDNLSTVEVHYVTSILKNNYVNAELFKELEEFLYRKIDDPRYINIIFEFFSNKLSFRRGKFIEYIDKSLRK